MFNFDSFNHRHFCIENNIKNLLRYLSIYDPIKPDCSNPSVLFQVNWKQFDDIQIKVIKCTIQNDELINME